MVAGMRDELLIKARIFHRYWRRCLNKTAANEQEVLDEPEKWAPVLANQLADRTEYLRSEALKRYGIDLFKDPDEWPPHMKGSSSVHKPRDLMLMITEVALLLISAQTPKPRILAALCTRE
jgi:hypothetical protein